MINEDVIIEDLQKKVLKLQEEIKELLLEKNHQLKQQLAKRTKKLMDFDDWYNKNRDIKATENENMWTALKEAFVAGQKSVLEEENGICN